MHWTHHRCADYRDGMFDLDRFVADCRTALTTSCPAAAIGELTERAVAAPAAVAVIHSVVNPLGRFTGAIHVYGGDCFGMPRSEWAPDTLEERPFDVERARRAYAAANERGTMDRP
jgi:hypothetical protein